MCSATVFLRAAGCSSIRRQCSHRRCSIVGGRTRDDGGGRLGSERQPRDRVSITAANYTLLIDSPQYQHSRPSIMHNRVVRSTGTPAGSAASALGSRCAHASHTYVCMHGGVTCCLRVCVWTPRTARGPQAGVPPVARRPAEPAPAATACGQSASCHYAAVTRALPPPARSASSLLAAHVRLLRTQVAACASALT